MYTLLNLFSAFACGIALSTGMIEIIDKKYRIAIFYFVLTILNVLFALQII
jgi:hypothetical protein